MANILHNKMFRKIALVAGAVLAVTAVAAGTMVLLSRFTPPKQTEQPISQAEIIKQMELGRNSVISGTEKAAKGETDAAISLYKEGITHFEKAGDKESVSAVQLEIQYLERVKTMDKSTTSSADPAATAAEIVPTPVDPTKAPGYGVTATYPE